MDKKNRIASDVLEKHLLFLHLKFKYLFMMACVFIFVSVLLAVSGPVQILFTESSLPAIIFIIASKLIFVIGSYLMSLADKTESEIRKILNTKIALIIRVG